MAYEMGAQRRARPGEAKAWAIAAVGYSGRGCLFWPFASITKGYGVIGLGSRRKRVTINVSRFVCLKAHGDPPDERMDAAHNCGNRLCCNPRHLRWASRTDNCADKLGHGTHNRGERNYRTALTENDVLTIRAARKAGASGAVLARRYGVTQASICDIMKGRSWAWLKGEHA